MRKALIILFSLLVMVGCGNEETGPNEANNINNEKITNDNTEAVNDQVENEINNENENNENNEEPENETKEEEPLDVKVDIDKTVDINGATIVLQSLRVKQDKTELFGYWFHNSQYDKAHIGLLVTVVFKQNDKEIKILNPDRLLQQKDKMIDGSFDLEIERIDNSPIEIKLIANTDEMETESITIDIP